jgi:hypothetical protein
MRSWQQGGVCGGYQGRRLSVCQSTLWCRSSATALTRAPWHVGLGQVVKLHDWKPKSGSSGGAGGRFLQVAGCIRSSVRITECKRMKRVVFGTQDRTSKPCVVPMHRILDPVLHVSATRAQLVSCTWSRQA